MLKIYFLPILPLLILFVKPFLEGRAWLRVEDADEIHNKCNYSMNQARTNGWDTSTLGGLHSIASDLTRTKGRANLHQNGSIFSDAAASKLRANGENTPTSNSQVKEPILQYLKRQKAE
ncbi:hypothetical protein M8C21_010343 [Ambrosia artemisiifolia]|uniref:Uncharacterized protein n=1 Tax=Ambrosia artemisiifolia TaxID=4212 RepID=A0AAD5CS13_AMBAR|nr:hypothetical protein M8C21_010343 [Ambrosia artemisiifolia]